MDTDREINRNTNIQDLPNEIIMQICDYLKDKDLIRFACTCKYYKDLFDEELKYLLFMNQEMPCDHDYIQDIVFEVENMLGLVS
jgi:hypothetical protein